MLGFFRVIFQLSSSLDANFNFRVPWVAEAYGFVVVVLSEGAIWWVLV